MSAQTKRLPVEIQASLLELLSEGSAKREAAAIVGISTGELDEELALNEDFAGQVRQVEAQWRDTIFKAAVDRALEIKDAKLLLDILSRRVPSLYASPGTRKVHDDEHTPAGPIASMLADVLKELSGEVQ